MNILLSKFTFSEELKCVLENSPSVIVPETTERLYHLIFGSKQNDLIDVSYDVNGEMITEATVTRCKNGVAVNFTEDYMRRRDPDCMRISDDLPTDKPKFKDVYGYDFSSLKDETFQWLSRQELIVVPFKAGGSAYGYDAVLVCPRNTAFFALALSQLQAFVPIDSVDHFTPRAVVYVAPPFRHTHFKGRQVCVHNRSTDLHEVYAYNLYPGPSAKKGIYSVLLDIGENEGWVTAHASAARIITPYEMEMVMMHEGASGGGKSELLQEVRRDLDGRVLLGTDVRTGEKEYISMSDTCHIEPITDDMAICHPQFKTGSGKLGLYDGEEGWFLRVDGITHYGSDSMYERISIHPDEPLVFFNLQGAPNSTCLPWEHTLDSDGTPCSNPRVIVPRKYIDNIVTEPVEVDVRSFGVRMPPTTAAQPDYGIMGLCQVIPPALAWMWRLVAPRGFNNPSISGNSPLASEGVGSYWPFATGQRVKQANLLLEQILECPNTRYVLIPNQHIGAYSVGFAAEWISREYLARRGGVNMKMNRLDPARCSLMGYSLKEMKVDGQNIRTKFLRPETQEALGEQGYDEGAKILYDFFAKELSKFDVEELHPVGKEILELFKRNATVDEYCKITPMGLK
ncbi:MAG: DUF4914 family protein [Lachnospiraceae bacterium]